MPRRGRRGVNPGCSRVHDPGRSRHQHYRLGVVTTARTSCAGIRVCYRRVSGRPEKGIPALQRTQPRANTGRQISPFAGTAQGANDLCPQIGQNPPISGMRCPQWPHDFEPIALGFRLANHQTMNAIKANGTSRKSKTPSMTISSGKPMVRIGRSVSNFCKLGAPLLPHFRRPKASAFRMNFSRISQAPMAKLP